MSGREQFKRRYNEEASVTEYARLNKDKLREALAADVEAFLAQGGSINQVPSHLRADVGAHGQVSDNDDFDLVDL